MGGIQLLQVRESAKFCSTRNLEIVTRFISLEDFTQRYRTELSLRFLEGTELAAEIILRLIT